MLLKVIKVIGHLFILISFILGKPCAFLEKEDVDSHLVEYFQYNVSHHDNIADEPHAHVHKHSEDGDEHEHNHEHFKVSQSDLKLLCYSVKVITKFNIIESKQIYRNKNLISSPFPLKIYRPPIFS